MTYRGGETLPFFIVYCINRTSPAYRSKADLRMYETPLCNMPGEVVYSSQHPVQLEHVGFLVLGTVVGGAVVLAGE